MTESKRNLERQKHNLERQLREIESSRAWKLIQRIGRARAKVLAVLTQRGKKDYRQRATPSVGASSQPPSSNRRPRSAPSSGSTDGRPPVGQVNLGRLRRVKPISDQFGFDRGQPIDRYYIENFLASHADDIRGRVLEIKDASYTRRFGGERVTTSDVLDVVEDNQHATIHADLARADHVPSDVFDCIILTQTLQFIYELSSAVQTIHRILKPGGVLLATFPGISQSSCETFGEYYYWALTKRSARRLLEEAFPAENIEVEAYGNVLAAISFLHGLAAEELHKGELERRDPAYEVLITLRALKPQTSL